MNAKVPSVTVNRKLEGKLKKLRREPDFDKAMNSFRSLVGGFEMLNPNAAGIDIASEEQWVCIPEGRARNNVRRFGAYTVNLFEIRDWLLAHSITTVAMESTGVYWIPLYEILEEAGLEVCLVNAREMKSVSGRPKTDNLDCQWIQRLHTYGLLKHSFRPDDDICAIRSLHRHREALTKEVNRCVQRMQKMLHQMNVLLPKVVSDITGMTGMKIMRDIAAGVTDPVKLASHRHYHVKKSEEEIAEALRGNYRSELVYLLKTLLDHYDFLLEQERLLDIEIESRMNALGGKFELDGDTRKANEKDLKSYQKTNKHAPGFDVQTRVHELLGVDMCRVPGFQVLTVLGIVLETGTDMSRWPDAGHFASWLGLCPNPNKSGGKNLGTKTKKCSIPAARHFRMAASALKRNPSSLGLFYRRMRAKNGTAHAITATAHKLAVIYYCMVSRGEEYKEIDVSEYEAVMEEQRILSARRFARKLGFEIVPVTDEAKGRYETINANIIEKHKTAASQ